MFTLRVILIILSILCVFLQHSVASDERLVLQQPNSGLRKVLKEIQPVLLNTIADSSDSSSSESTKLTPRRLRKKKRKLQKLPEDGSNRINNTLGKQAEQEQQDYEELFRSLFQDEKFNQQRQAKLSSLSDLAFDVFKEIVAELITETLGSYLGFSSRTDSKVSPTGVGGILDMILDAVRKHTLRKKRGCL